MFCYNYVMVEEPETSLLFPPHQSSISVARWELQPVTPAVQGPLLPLPPERAEGLLEPWQEERAWGGGGSTAQAPAAPLAVYYPSDSLTSAVLC